MMKTCLRPSPTLTVNPFVSEAQRAACYAKSDPTWDCGEWQAKTKGRLPKRKGTRNARRPTPDQVDPTRTTALRNAFRAKLRGAFARFKGELVRFVGPKVGAAGAGNAFGLTANCRPGQLREAGGRCGPGVGIDLPRERMPQIPTDTLDTFVSWCRNRGVAVTLGRVRADDLSPTQGEFRQERVDAIPDDRLTQPILVSRDDYVLDGTHRWVKHWQRPPKGESAVPVLKIDRPLREALELMRTFPHAKFVANAGDFEFHSDPAKVEAFQRWLAGAFAKHLTSKAVEAAWEQYIRKGFEKGAGRAFDDWSIKERAGAYGDAKKTDWYEGGRERFLESSFARPVAREKVELLVGRAFDELEDVTREMSNKMSRVLGDGLVQGSSPRDVAREMSDVVEVSRVRAEVIARTEIIRAHAEGQLLALEGLGVTEVGVQVEFTVTEDERLCPECAAMAGTVTSIEDAKGLIPLHPNCRCAWVPAGVGEKRLEESPD